MQGLIGQNMTKKPQQTVKLSRFTYASLNTSKGTPCVCTISNISSTHNALISNIGAADNVRFESGVPFSGIHSLIPRQRLIVFSDFGGNKLLIGNLSQNNVSIFVSLLCFNGKLSKELKSEEKPQRKSQQ